MKDIALFFKEISEAQLKDPGASLKMVLKFQDKCIKQRKPLFKQFKEPEDFEKLFRTKIEEIGWREYHALRSPIKNVLDPAQPAAEDKKLPETPTTSGGLIGTPSADFVSELLCRPADWEATTSHDVARFRLIALATFRTGNDEMYLGNHDANLLFSKRHHYNFDGREIITLIDTGIVAFNHQNVPLWFWMAASSKFGDLFERVRLLSVVGNAQEKSNAIRILQCTAQKTPELSEAFGKQKVLNQWLLGEVTDEDYKSAIEFLKVNGDLQDLQILETFLDKIPARRKSALAEVIVILWARHDLSKGFERLIELDPDTMGEAGANMLFAAPEAVVTNIAVRCIKLKAENIRRRATAVLHTRQAIDVSTAQSLLADPDLEVRLIAIESLVRHGIALQEETIKGALVRQQPGSLWGLGLGTSGRPDDSYYRRFQKNRLSHLSYNELRKRVDACDVFDNLEIITIYRNYTGRCLKEIRSNLTDRFKAYFASKLAITSALGQFDAKRVESVQKREGYLRNILISGALEALCAFADGEDLELVRATLDNCEVSVSEDVLRFMGRFGDWTDIPRILALSQRRYTGLVLSISFLGDELAKPIARTLYAIGKARLADLLQLETDSSIRRELIAQFGQKDIAKLSDGFLIEQLNNSDDQTRRIMALKCAQSLTQARVAGILEKYVNQEGHRYYNSIHWLDLAASMPKQVVKAVAKFELNRRA